MPLRPGGAGDYAGVALAPIPISPAERRAHAVRWEQLPRPPRTGQECKGVAMRFVTYRRRGPGLLGLAAVAAAVAVAVPASASAATQPSPVVGHVYVNDNTAG